MKKSGLLLLALILFIACVCIALKSVEPFTSKNRKAAAAASAPRLCLLYAYYEKNDLYKSNFAQLLQDGLLDEVDYYIVVNGACTVPIPERSNVHVFHRPNVGYDFGAYSYLIEGDHLQKRYDYYFFMNTSVAGPYTIRGEPWYQPFLALFRPSVAVVGTTINILNVQVMDMYEGDVLKPYDLTALYGAKPVYPHVQSMFFCLHDAYFQELVRDGFFQEADMNAMDMNNLIVQKEVGLSQLALNKGYNINCLLERYRDLDYRTLTENINPASNEGDPYYDGGYFGGSIEPEDVVFYKNNR